MSTGFGWWVVWKRTKFCGGKCEGLMCLKGEELVGLISGFKIWPKLYKFLKRKNNGFYAK
jgi:hypothetical protein